MADDPPAAKYLAVEEADVSHFGSVYWLDRFPDKWSELERFYKAGVIPALYDALCLAKRIGISAPDWALKGAIEVIGDRISEGFSIGKGATGNESSKYRKSMQPAMAAC